MKEHLCPVEKALIAYEGECNWCGQKEWVGLTDDEYFGLQMKIKTPMVSVQDYIDAMRMVEAKLKELNT